MTTRADADTAPTRGTRPKNRRSLILGAAADLFYARGYANVSMTDVAEAVNVRPSALYRHFSSKSELLREATHAELTPFRDVVAQAATLEEAIPLMAEAAVAHPRLGLLWQRESRSLPAADIAALAHELHRITDGLIDLIVAARPDLPRPQAQMLAWSALSVLRSVPRKGARPSQRDYELVLASIIERILTFSQPTADNAGGLAEPATGAPYVPHAMRERLMAVAVPLIARTGYADTSLEEIAAQAGIASPSVYHYFDSKQELLYAALSRGAEGVLLDTYRVLSAARGPQDALRALTTFYVGFALNNSATIDNLITNTQHLAGNQRVHIVRCQDNFRTEWTYVLMNCRADLTRVTARATVRAVLAVIDDFARTPILQSMPHRFANLAEIVMRVQRAAP